MRLELRHSWRESQTVYLAPIETRGTALEGAGIVPSHSRILDDVRALPGVEQAGMLGLYGVMAQHVGRRLHEFGIRAALGGRRADLMRAVGARALRIAGPGFVVGSVLAVGAGYALSSQLYGVRRFEPVLFAVAVLVVAAAAAVLAPARRAARADVVSVLRDH